MGWIVLPLRSNAYVESLTLQCDGIWKWGLCFARQLGSDELIAGEALMMELLSL